MTKSIRPGKAWALSVATAMALVMSLLGPIGSAEAQTDVRVDPALAAAADAVVNVTIGNSTNVLVDDMPYRLFTATVDDVLNGSAGETVQIAVDGGVNAVGATVFVSHQPELSRGDRVQVALIPAAEDVVSATDGQVYVVAGGESGVVPLNASTRSALESFTANAAGDFVLNGSKWSSFDPAPIFKINPTGSGVDATSTLNAVIRAANRWENDPGSDIDLAYGGTTTKRGRKTGDGASVVSFESHPSEGWLAQASWTGWNGRYEFDIVLNTRYAFSDGATPGKFNIESVILHEMGHILGLGHTSAASEVMYASITSGQAKYLGPGDLNGVKTMYPAAGGIESPLADSVLACGAVTVSWSGSGSGLWHVRAGSTARGLQYFAKSTSSGSSLSVTGLPSDGSQVHVSLWHRPSGGAWRVVDEVTYTACGSAGIESPAPGSVLACTSATVSWSGSASGLWHVRAGSTPRGLQHFAKSTSSGSSMLVTNLPDDGSAVHVSLWHRPSGGSWKIVDEVAYTACGSPGFVSPFVNAVLPCGVVDVTWSGSAPGLWHVRAGSTARGLQYFAKTASSGSSLSITGLPDDGSKVYVSLWHLPPGGTWKVMDETTYTACGSAGIQSPSAGSVLPCVVVDVTWSGSAPGLWHVRAGSTARGLQYFAKTATSGSTLSVTGLPSDGSTVHLSLWHLPPGGTWSVIDEITHTACTK